MLERIKELCARNGITVKALERTLGLGNGTIRLWDKSSPSVEKLYMVADFFGVSLDYLLLGEGEPNHIGGFSADAMAIAQIVDRLPPDARRMLLLQVQALEQAIPDPGAAAKSQESE